MTPSHKTFSALFYSRQIPTVSNKIYSLSALGIYIIINILFIIKYGFRITELGTSVFSILYVFSIWLFYKNLISSSKYSSQLSIRVLSVYTVIMGIIVPIFFEVGTFHVDRWDMINVFSEAFCNGDYPYNATGNTSDNHPAQSPIYFALCYPFELLQWYVGITLAGLWIFYWSNSKLGAQSYVFKTTIFLVLAPFIIYETLTCSTIFFNSSVILLWISFFDQQKIHNKKFVMLHGIIGGLLLATRNCYALPYIILGIVLLKNYKPISNILIWGFCILLSFTTVFSFFIFGWGLDSWINMNPFKIQSELIISLPCILFLITMSIVIGLYLSDILQAIFYSGIILFIASFLMLCETIYKTGFYTAFIESRADLTYFILGAPFLLPFIFKTKTTHDKR